MQIVMAIVYAYNAYNVKHKYGCEQINICIDASNSSSPTVHPLNLHLFDRRISNESSHLVTSSVDNLKITETTLSTILRTMYKNIIII